MIYLFHGSDATKTRAKAFQWVAAARAKQPEAPYVRLEASALTQETLAEAIGSQGLFFAKTLVLLDDPFSLTESGELILQELEALATSANPIAIVAPGLLATRAKKIAAKAEKTFVVDRAQKQEVRGFNAPLVHALARGNGVVLWQELMKAYRAGDAPEMVHGLLHWKARDLMEKGGGVWEKEEARALSRRLIELLSDSRGGALALRESLEQFALSLQTWKAGH